MKKIFVLLLPILLIILLLPVYVLFWTPRAEAKNYLEENLSDFQNTQEDINNRFAAFYDQSKRDVGNTHDIFEDMKSSVSYEDAIKSAKSDINTINKAIRTVERSKYKKEGRDLPESLQTLDNLLNEYYKMSAEALEIQLEYQEFQLLMLEANGPELEIKLRDINDVLSEIKVDLWVSYFDELENLATESHERFTSLEDVPVMGEMYYEFRLSYLFDLKNLSQKVSNYLRVGDEKSTKDALNLIKDFSDDLVENQSTYKGNFNSYMDSSGLGLILKELKLSERTIDEEISLILKKYFISLEK